RKLAPEPFPGELHRGLEHQRRKKHVEDKRRRKWELRRTRQQSDEEAGDYQADDVRQAEATRQHRNEARNEQQEPDWPESDVGHGICHNGWDARGQFFPPSVGWPTRYCRSTGRRVRAALREEERGMRVFLLATAMSAALTASGCKVSNAPDNNTGQAAAVQGGWPGFVNGFIEASFKANPGFAVAQGRHEYDGQIGDLSQAGVDSEVARLKKAIADAQSFSDDKLTPEQRYQRDYLIAVAKGQLFWIDPEGADQLHNNPAAYLGAFDPSVYVTVPYAPKEQRLKSYIKFLETIPTTAERMRANIKTPMATSFVDYGKSAFGGFVTYYPGDGMAAWKGVGTPEDQKALKVATDNAVKAMQTTAAWVEGQ